MRIQKLSSTDAFIAFDLDDAPAAGITRLARKVLQDGAELLARSTTYAFASFGIQMGGGSAGINAEGDGRDAAVAAFVAEVQEMVASGRWATDPGVGLREDDFAALRAVDPRPSELWAAGLASTLTARGAVAAAGAVRGGGLSGATVAVAGAGPVADAARAEAEAAGATVAGGTLGAEVDVLLVAGKAGLLDHDAAAEVHAAAVVPLSPVVVTARAHADLVRAGRVHVPDFLATAAPLLHAHGSDMPDPVGAVAAKVAELAPKGPGMWMAAVEEAEAFLTSWRPALPFGRPLS